MLDLPSSHKNANTTKLLRESPSIKSRSLRCYLKALLIIVLLACFLVQCWDGFFKFVARQTTLVSNRVTAQSDTLPTISFCPGFKGTTTTGWRTSTSCWRSKVSKNKSLLYLLRIVACCLDDQTPLDAWMADTYDLSEMILMVKPPGAWASSADTQPDHLGYYEDLNMTDHLGSVDRLRALLRHPLRLGD